MKKRTFFIAGIWSIILGTWISSSLISFNKGQKAFIHLSSGKKCWYDTSLKSFKEELIELAEKVKKLEEKNKKTELKKTKKNIYEKLKKLINSEEKNISHFCEKRFDTLMKKLNRIFNEEKINENSELMKLKEELLYKLDPRWNKYNDLNYDQIWKWKDFGKGITENMIKK